MYTECTCACKLLFNINTPSIVKNLLTRPLLPTDGLIISGYSFVCAYFITLLTIQFY